jgi:ABC-type multidrug transport system permease subunit
MFGRSIADAALTTWGILVVSVLAFVIGFRVEAGIAEAALALSLLLFATYTFMWVFITIGITSKNAQAANGTATLLIIPLAFVSAAYVPAHSLPAWMQPVADNQPLTILANALRSLLLGGADAVGLRYSTYHWVGLSIAWCVSILLVFSTVAVTRFARRR